MQSQEILLIKIFYNMMKLESWLAFACGIVAGGTMVMMMAPRARKEMCANFKRKLDDAKECVEETMKKCHAHSCDCMENIAEKNDAVTFEE